MSRQQTIQDAEDYVWAWLSAPGTWFTAAENIAIAEEARAADEARRGSSPLLSDAQRDHIARIVNDPAATTNADYEACLAAGVTDAEYVETVGVVACVIALDRFARALGRQPTQLPAAQRGEPSLERPDDVGADGAFVPMTVPYRGPNVARALSLVPDTQLTFLGLTRAMYSGDRFGNLVWEDEPLARPQVELLAARVSALNECFY